LSEPPVAPRRPAPFTRHGITVADDYAWLKDPNWQKVLRDPSLLQPDIRAYLEAENRHAGEILAWYRRAWRALSFAEHRRFWRLVLAERQPSRARAALMARLGGELFGGTYVHFQLDKKSAPTGTVFALARAWLDHLRSRGIRGALLPSVPGGEAALEMWKRIGFTPVPVVTPAGTPATWLLAVL